MNRYLKYVLIISGFNIITTLLLFFINKPLVASSKFFFVQFFFLITVLIVGMYRRREQSSFALDYGDRFKFCFLVGFISNLPSYLLILIIYKLDAGYRMLAYNQQIEIAGALTRMISKVFGNINKYQVEEQTVDQMIVLGDVDKFDLYSGTMVFSAMVNSFVFYLVLALVLSLFIGSEKMSLKERWRRIDL